MGKILADKSKCHDCGIVIYMDKANDYCPRCDRSTEWTEMEENVEIEEKQLGLELRAMGELG